MIPASWLSPVTVCGLPRLSAAVPGTGVPSTGVPSRAGMAASGTVLLAVPGTGVPGTAESLLSTAERLRTLTSDPVSLGLVSLGLVSVGTVSLGLVSLGAIPRGAVLLGAVSLRAIPGRPLVRADPEPSPGPRRGLAAAACRGVASCSRAGSPSADAVVVCQHDDHTGRIG